MSVNHTTSLEAEPTLAATGRRLTLEQLNQLAEHDGWYDAWLQSLLADLPQFSAALLAVQGAEAVLQPVALWPRSQQQLQRLADLVDECCREQHPLLLPPHDQQTQFGIAYPVMVDGRLVAVFAGFVPLQQEAALDALMAAVEKQALWIESWFTRAGSRRHQQQIRRQSAVIDGFVAVGKGAALQEAALHWVDSLARDFRCDRVSLGRVKQQQVKLEVISGSTEYNLSSVPARQIRRVMQEACDQRAILQWPPQEGTAGICLQAEKLSVAHRNASVLTVPVYHDEQPYLVLTFERPAGTPFSAEETEHLEAALALVGVAFHHRRQAELSLWGGLAKHARLQLERLLAPGYVKRKLFFIALVALVVFLGVARGEYQINADAVLEPRQIRIVSAPFGGYLKAADVRAGDRVAAGQALAAMEDNELRLERIKASSRLSQNNKHYTEALAGGDRAQAQIYFAQMEEARAALASAESKLERSRLTAPFDALVVSGDLSQRIGGSVNQGEELFRLSPMTDYRLILYVNEYRISDLTTEQGGRVVLSSMPNQGFDFVVESVTPVTEVRDGSTVFRVEARLLQHHSQFRPGLVGIAKVSAGRRHLIDIWTLELRKWLQLKIWSFWG
ncbi:efflux RND transporter periplasmic adaptor subunit [Pseudomaricurvus sp. HS19]|uniref:efflux RND transporter periplasmic adaptor subunit n=1 Tax=Pseudomaricurvus sp. HS19 TaxID=2692626 RepID=UPI0013685341|nr:HlyD family efflux transporter periplasmic adaptor subunit [Pseudomaricurvus sp. HS19]MYM65181.1 HlyD family efflux transporter periplasmic adaptor subunit [Pseudomaricurvus sp. HS19]